MKIVFLTACLEPGRDGVGDYTRRLAEECVRLGHSCMLMALNDPFVKNRDFSVSKNSDQNLILTARFSSQLTWNRRVELARDFAHQNGAPDGFSLQFVSYGFHAKGFVPGFGKKIKAITGNIPCHLMFHETWIGVQAGASFQARVMGALQKFWVQKLVKDLQPQPIHTSNLVYLDLLERAGIRAQRLPLFGNIPRVSQNADAWLFAKFNGKEGGIQKENRNSFWFFGFFASLDKNWKPEPLLTQIAEAGKRFQRKPVLISVGNQGGGAPVWEEMEKQYQNQFYFLKLGEQNSETISEVLNSLDFGIATTPSHLLGRSGSAIAMAEHGLPVLTSEAAVSFSDLKKQKPNSLCPEVTRLFLEEVSVSWRKL